MVSVTPPEVEIGSRAADWAGLSLALVELGLADLPEVMSEVVGAPVSPGLTWALRPRAAWSLTLTVERAGTTALVGELCNPTGACDAVSGQGGSEVDPAPAVAQLLGAVAERLERRPSVEAVASWGQRGTGDDYAALMAGRSAASFYGLRPPAAVPGDRKSDPVARAFYLDPGMPVATWMASRSAPDRHPVAARRAALARPASLLLLADLAWSLDQVAQVAPVVDALYERSPTDRRFAVLMAAHRLAQGRLQDASTLLDRLGAGAGAEPQVARLRVAIADAAGPKVDLALLQRWREADPHDPEPVRRLIDRAVERRDYQVARDLLPDLRARGGVGVDELDLALWFALGERERAAAVALKLGEAPLAERLRQPPAPSSVRPSPIPRVP